MVRAPLRQEELAILALECTHVPGVARQHFRCQERNGARGGCSRKLNSTSRLIMRFWPLHGPDSPNRRIFRAAIIVGALTLLAKAGATVKELLVARTFGRGDCLDAFLISYLLPSFAVALMMSALTSTMIPAMVEARERRGEEGAQQLFSSMMVLSLLALVAVGVLLGIAAPLYLPLLASGFSLAKLHLTRKLLYALLPFAVFSGFSGCAAAVLNARERFALPS